MGTLHARTSKGRKYWSIVESRRVNGKPRPVIIEYLGTAETLLKRLQNSQQEIQVKSYTHGLPALLLKVGVQLDLVPLINKYVNSQRKYTTQKPLRNGLTVGATLLLGAIGRVCCPTSKRGWQEWASQTSLPYLMRTNFSKVDSQHFWDLMDAFPVEAIPKVERCLLDRIMESYNIKTDTLFYDTTNFYTFIATTNNRCSIAKRGKNKQKRSDLRQVGLAMMVTKEDYLPLIHETYEGCLHDAKVFKKIIGKIKQRMLDLGMKIDSHTVVFDRGANSTDNLNTVKELKLHYIGALTPCYHNDLIIKAKNNWETMLFDGEEMKFYRTSKEVWGDKQTVIVFISKKLREGHIRGMRESIKKKQKQLIDLSSILLKKKKEYHRKELVDRIDGIIKGKYRDVFKWKLYKKRNGPYILESWIDIASIEEIEANLGFRIIMTDRHDWETDEIIKGYCGQSFIENAFRNIKNPFHLAVTPEFHWTDQKIRVHFFICVLGYIFSVLLWKIAKEQMSFKGNLNTLLNKLSQIRLAVLAQMSGERGKPKLVYQLEKTTEEIESFINAFDLKNLHKKPLKPAEVSVY